MTVTVAPDPHLAPAERVLMKGNEAIAEAAIQAGCDAYFGYPITPQAELLEWMARRMPELGRTFVQAESELAAINMALGASAAGARVLVSSSSPGMSLMAEAMSYMAGSEVPVLLVNVMRGGPGLGSIGPAQSDYFQATKGHGHGDYRVPVLAPSSIAEAISLVADGFELAERYRTPVILLADGILGQAMEPVDGRFRTLPPRHDDWSLSGADGREPRVVKSLHLRPEALEAHNEHLQAKFREITAREVRWVGEHLDDAEIAIVAYGTAARVARTARARRGCGWASSGRSACGRSRPPRSSGWHRGCVGSSPSSCRPASWSRTSASRSKGACRSSSTAERAAWSPPRARSSTPSGGFTPRPSRARPTRRCRTRRTRSG
jgi:2-oxoglutarate ferredoxin oxidoreductase subunit alpha